MNQLLIEKSINRNVTQEESYSEEYPKKVHKNKKIYVLIEGNINIDAEGGFKGDISFLEFEKMMNQ